MAKNSLDVLVEEQKILNKIFVIRGEKIMLDKDLAALFNVETRVLNQSLKRNIKRFPKDFMFQLNEKEFTNLMSQSVISSWGGNRKLPFAFTEQGVSMLSGILNSDIAIEVHIRIIRVFVKMREYALTNKEILMHIAKMEQEVKGNTKDIENIFVVIKELIEKQQKPIVPREPIGFKTLATKNVKPIMKLKSK
jgi:ORF6N domain